MFLLVSTPESYRSHSSCPAGNSSTFWNNVNNVASIPAILTVGYQGISCMVAHYQTCTPKGYLERAQTWLEAAAELLDELTDEDRQNIERLSDPRITTSLNKLQASYKS